MMPETFNPEEKTQLLKLARQAITAAVTGEGAFEPDLSLLSPRLRQLGASFVTLTEEGELRGCIGTLDAYQPLALDVCEHAVSAALDDFRFFPVRREEVPYLKIEVSVLTAPQPLEYSCGDDLIRLVRPGIDGLIFRDGIRRATFLPQVWEKIPDHEGFFGQLCMKMGAQSDLWKRKRLQAFVYQVEEFHE